MNNVVAALALTAIIIIIISVFNAQTGYVTEPAASDDSLSLGEDNLTYQQPECPECEECAEPECPEPQCPEPTEADCPEDTTPYAQCNSCCEDCPSSECPPEANEQNCQQFCGDDGGEPEYLYVGSINSDKYHYPDCTYVQKIKPENQIWFVDKEDAKSQGYVPCGVCKPPG